MTENQGFWTGYVDQFVKIDTSQKSYLGKVESTNFELTVLKPSLLDRRVGDGGDIVLEKKIPTTIDSRAIIAISPQSKEHLDNVCRLWNEEKLKNQEKNRRIIL
jgi:hypothetical protein